MGATAESLVIDLDMVAVGSEMERKVLELAREMLKSQSDRVAELEKLAGFSVGELCESCGIDPNIVAERLMQAQERVNDLNREANEHHRAILDHADILLQMVKAERRVEELEADQEPRPMSEAPEEGTRILECYSNGERHIAWYSLVPDKNRIGWLPAKDPTP